MPVVGSANLDVVVSLQGVPAPGETVMGDHLEEVAGGKGLNQSVAAAHEAACAFVGCAGDDGAGRLLTEALVQARVDVSQITRTPQPTGRAYIEVTPDGEHRIVVMALANGLLDAADVTAALDALGTPLRRRCDDDVASLAGVREMGWSQLQVVALVDDSPSTWSEPRHGELRPMVHSLETR